MATAHENEFMFLGEGELKLEFTYNNEYKVTKGQPFYGVNPTSYDSTSKIIINAGRKGSKECATWYKDFVNKNENNMIHTEDGSHSPNELNFAIKGTLKIEDNTYDICLGQGHYGSTNNWHLASSDIVSDENGKNGTMGGIYKIKQYGSYTFKVDKA